MARPNDSGALAGQIRGLREAKAAFQALPEVTRDAMLDATTVTVSEIARLARTQIERSPSIETRSLLNAIAFKVTPTSGRGRVGVTSGQTTMVVGGRKVKVKGIVVAGRNGSASIAHGAKLIRPSRYAHLVEFGSRKMRAEPFMIPAAESQKQPYIERCRAAGKKIETGVAAVGGRLL